MNQFRIIYVVLLLVFTGCPDYSHLRPVPDYENMVDPGEEAAED